MYVCLCCGITNQAVVDAVVAGATTCKQVATACRAGSDCGRCSRTIRSIIDAVQPSIVPSPKGSRP
ncbi:(2Fe-2S)-binding protein [Candidatus Mycobacterium wuenschmannii]|uniref:Bacterioferritin-associated ferredoxin n=1 Tax=Candidatus Mycobacterium wuenschmannii TaxID=3027808 RepID=A0ABY8W331_9MYCO|nr:(2Fe-2S)-binding protein [Candidatus Mycobacterium wuenschmannii]WIM90275.1 (2Fe-2S)-binding protein [Candidatus Mycobacterium wuenschmannii]